MSQLTETLDECRRKLAAARASNDVATACVYARKVARLQGAMEAAEDTPEQAEDYLLGWVRMRQLELEEAERLLIDNRPEGVALISRLVAEMGERFETAMTWETKKESKAS